MVFTEFRKKWKIGGSLFREFPRTIESCKVGCIFSSSPLRSTSAWYLASLYKVWSWTSMWSGRKEQLNKTDVHMAWRWSAWLFLHPHYPTFYRRLFDCDCCWSSNSSPPATRSFMPTQRPLLPSNSSVLRKSDTRIPIPSIARLGYTISTHCIASWISS